MIELRYHRTGDGKTPFQKWFFGLDAQAAAKVTKALVRLEQGNLSNAKGVGAGCYRIPDRLEAWLSGLSRPGRRRAGDPADSRHEETAAARYRDGSYAVG